MSVLVERSLEEAGALYVQSVACELALCYLKALSFELFDHIRLHDLQPVETDAYARSLVSGFEKILDEIDVIRLQPELYDPRIIRVLDRKVFHLVLCPVRKLDRVFLRDVRSEHAVDEALSSSRELLRELYALVDGCILRNGIHLGELIDAHPEDGQVALLDMSDISRNEFIYYIVEEHLVLQDSVYQFTYERNVRRLVEYDLMVRSQVRISILRLDIHQGVVSCSSVNVHQFLPLISSILRS